MNTFWKQKDIFCQLITQMGKSYKQWQGWQQFGRTGSIPRAKENILFIQCFLTFSQRPSSQIVHFWVQTKPSKLVKSIDAAITNPEVQEFYRCCHFFFFFLFFFLEMALVASWLLSKMNSVTVPILSTRQWRAKIRLQTCPTYMSKYCNIDKYFSAVHSLNTKLLLGTILYHTIWLFLYFSLPASFFIWS